MFACSLKSVSMKILHVVLVRKKKKKDNRYAHNVLSWVGRRSLLVAAWCDFGEKLLRELILRIYNRTSALYISPKRLFVDISEKNSVGTKFYFFPVPNIYHNPNIFFLIKFVIWVRSDELPNAFTLLAMIIFTLYAISSHRIASQN